MNDKDNKDTWLVWSPQGNLPNVRHKSLGSAIKEAERLAGLNPGKEFYVLIPVGVATVKKPNIYMALCAAGDDEIPF
jgi:hypothetical protein